LPKPIAIFTWNASCAREILFGCQAAGIIVPEEVAVLSGADDDLLCEISHIPISAIKVAAEQIGFQAAAILDEWMTSRCVPKKNIVIPPLEVVTRQSTDTLAVKDRALAKALNFIRGKASQPIQVDEVAAHTGISRRALERRFSKILGRTPADEIRRHHLEAAKKLLGETDMRIPEIADAAGFGSPEYMAYVFRRELGLNPRRYRKDIASRR
jgi:LacI family transcriptional regulator